MVLRAAGCLVLPTLSLGRPEVEHGSLHGKSIGDLMAHSQIQMGPGLVGKRSSHHYWSESRNRRSASKHNDQD